MDYMTDSKYQIRFVKRNECNSELIEIWEFDQFTHEIQELLVHTLYGYIDCSAGREVVVARVRVNDRLKYSYRVSK